MYKKRQMKFSALLTAAFVSGVFTTACSSLVEKNRASFDSRHSISVPVDWSRPADLSLVSTGKVMVILAFGQSNSANFGQTGYRPKHEVYSYFRGSLYRASDPMFGADGLKGSVWTRLADMLVDSGMCDRVVFVTIGIGATPVQCWTDGECSEYLRDTLEGLRSDNIRLTHILWHQGEQDNLQRTGHTEYTARMNRLLAMIRGYGQDAPLYVSMASWHPNDFDKSFISKEVRQGQADFINNNQGVLLGPDTDTLVSEKYRYDRVHFSSEGLDAFARLWLYAIKDNSEKVK